MEAPKMTAAEMRRMVGCSVHFRGHEAVIASSRWDMQMVRVEWDGGWAIVRPSEIL